ncbi:MAG TPA: Mpo1-like protein, partial [Thermoanaerobaculia bacterium]|nr:Mpo1-like protein [Thermoanaerobaculia bacterium]
RIDALLADYAEAHRTPGNVVCHTVGISLIVFGILSMASAVPIGGTLTAAEVLLAAAFVVYIALDPALGAATVAAAILLDLLARLVSDWRVGAVAFVIGWIFQGIGHAVFEKNRPAFLRNLAHLLVGPAYLVNKLVRIRPIARTASGAAR